MTRSPFPLLSVWALGLLLVACGGGGDDDNDGDPPPDEGTPPPVVVASYKQQVLGLLEGGFLVSCRPNLSTPNTDRTLSVNDAGVLTLSGKDPIDFSHADAVLSVSRTVVSGTAPAGVALLGGQGELSIGMTLVPAGSNYQIDAAYYQDDRVSEVQSCAPRGPQSLAGGWRGDEVLRALLSDESGTLTCASSALGVLPAMYTYSLHGGVLSLSSSGSNQQFNLVGAKQDELFQLPSDPRNPTAAPADSIAYSATLSTGATIALQKSAGAGISLIEAQGTGSGARLSCSR